MVEIMSDTSVRSQRERWVTRAIYGLIVLLPWQTVWIVQERLLNQGAWEYGKTTIYLSEVVIWFLVAWRGRPQWTLPTTVRPFLVAVASCVVIGSVVSPDPLLAASHMWHVISAIALVSLIVDARIDKHRIQQAFVIGALMPAGLGIVQTLTGMAPAFSWAGLASHAASVPGDSVVEAADGVRTLRAYGTLPHPNIFGAYMVVAMVCAGWQYTRTTSRRVRIALACALALFSIAVFVSFSRGAWIAVSVAAAVAGITALWTRRARAHVILPLLGVVGGTLVCTSVVFHTQLATRIFPHARLEQRSLTERAAALTTVDDVVRMNPFFGVGAGQYTAALARVHPGFPSYAYQPVHNTLLIMLGELGGLTMGACALAVYAARKQLQAWQQVGSLTLLTVIVCVGVFDHFLWSVWPGLVLTSLTIAMAYQPKRVA